MCSVKGAGNRCFGCREILMDYLTRRSRFESIEKHRPDAAGWQWLICILTK